MKRTITNSSKLERRLQAVKLFQSGTQAKDIANAVGISVSTVRAVIALFRVGGIEAVRGAPNLGGKPSFIPDPTEQTELFLATNATSPRSLEIASEFWTVKAFGVVLSQLARRPVPRHIRNDYLSRWGVVGETLSLAALSIDPSRASSWLSNELPSLLGGARKGRYIISWIQIRAFNAEALFDSDGAYGRNSFQMRVEYGKTQLWRNYGEVTNETVSDFVRNFVMLVSKDIKVILTNLTNEKLMFHSRKFSFDSLEAEIVESFGLVELKSENDYAELAVSPVPNVISISIDGSNLVICAPFAAGEGHQKLAIDLNDRWLPSTPFSDGPVALANEAKLCDLLLACLNERASHSRNTKSAALTLYATAGILIKLFEWSWLNGTYDPLTLLKKDFDRLAIDLAKKGWSGALDVRRRAQELLSCKTEDEASKYLTESRSRGYTSVSMDFCREIGSNVMTRELVEIKEEIYKKLSLPPDRVIRGKISGNNSAKLGMGESHLRQTFSAFNLLSQIENPAPLTYTPFPATVAAAKDLGRAGGRTGNLEPDQVGKLLVESMRMVREVAPILIKTIEEYIEKTRQGFPTQNRYEYDLDRLRLCGSFAALEHLVGRRITSFNGLSRNPEGVEISFNQVIFDVYTGCQVAIVFLNARRKDEIQGSKIGLYLGSLEVFDGNLDLHTITFYIEKRAKYKTYFVTKFTVLAVRALEGLSSLARQWRGFAELRGSEARGHSMLMELPILSAAGLQGAIWFQFDCSADGRSFNLISRAIGSYWAARFNIHMGRRAYALIFFYRFEDANLLSLVQHLEHGSMGNTSTYLRDGRYSAGRPRAVEFGPTAAAEKDLRDAYAAELDQSFLEVGREKLLKIVDQILFGDDRRDGGFKRLVQRFHQKVAPILKYDLKDVRKSSEVIANILQERGHMPHPFPHGDCMAVDGRRNAGARCRSSDGIAPNRQNARIQTCNGCAYHTFVEEHSRATQVHIDAQKAQVREMSQNSLRASSLTLDIVDAERFLELRRVRFAQATAG